MQSAAKVLSLFMRASSERLSIFATPKGTVQTLGWNSFSGVRSSQRECGLWNAKSMITRFCCYRAVVRLEPTKPAYMKASSKRVWRLPGSSASRSAPSTHR